MCMHIRGNNKSIQASNMPRVHSIQDFIESSINKFLRGVETIFFFFGGFGEKKS